MWSDCAANYLLRTLPHIQQAHKIIFMNVGRKWLVELYPKMFQSVLEALDSVKYINVKENATIWTITSELR